MFRMKSRQDRFTKSVFLGEKLLPPSSIDNLHSRSSCWCNLCDLMLLETWSPEESLHAKTKYIFFDCDGLKQNTKKKVESSLNWTQQLNSAFIMPFQDSRSSQWDLTTWSESLACDDDVDDDERRQLHGEETTTSEREEHHCWLRSRLWLCFFLIYFSEFLSSRRSSSFHLSSTAPGLRKWPWT